MATLVFAQAINLGALVGPILGALIGGGLYQLLKLRDERRNARVDRADRAMGVVSDALENVDKIHQRLTAAYTQIGALEQQAHVRGAALLAKTEECEQQAVELRRLRAELGGRRATD